MTTLLDSIEYFNQNQYTVHWENERTILIQTEKKILMKGIPYPKISLKVLSKDESKAAMEKNTSNINYEKT